MKKNIENSLSMFKAVKAVCDNNIALINANLGLQDTYGNYLHMLVEMDLLGQNQTKDRTGITKDKQHAREKLELAIEAASGIIKAHFDHDNNFDVFNLVNKAFSTLQGMRDQRLVAHGQLVRELLVQYQVELASFGVDATYISDYQKVLDAYIDIVAKPTMSRNDRTATTLLLSSKTKEISAFLKNELDGAILVIKQDHLSVWITYRNARKIVNNGIRHNPLLGIITGVVKQDETNTPMANVLIEVIGTETVIVTNDSGAFTIIDVPPATYTIKACISGYEVKMVENVVVTAQQTTTIEIKMTASV